MKIRHFLFFFNFHWFFFFSSSFLSFFDARLCELFFFPLSIFLAFAIPSPTHACHRRSGGSSLISGAAKNRGRTREAERESLCCFNGEEIVSWNVCGSTACLANWSHASLCLNSEYQRLDLPHHCDFPPVEKGGAYTCPRFCCCSGWFFLFFLISATTAGDQTLFGQCNVQMSSFDAISSVNMCCIGCL